MDLTRRDAIKGAAAATAIGALGALGASQARATEGEAGTATSFVYAKTPADVADMEQASCDVLVIGGGGAGVCAALAAAEQGAQVIRLEKMGDFGGASAMSSGKIPAVGTKLQEERGEQDSIGACAMDIFRPSNYSVREDLVYTVVENSKDLIEWTEGYGVVWTLDETLYYGQTAYRMHTADGGGAGLMQPLIDSMGTVDAIEQMLEFQTQGLVVDGDTVVGAYGTNAEGAEVAITAKATVLATTGFGNNPDMIAQYCPEAAAAVPVVAPGATGEGILWAQELGADLQNMGAYQGHAFHCIDNGTTGEQGIANNGGIMVNLEGNRFANEYTGYSELSPHVVAQTDHVAFLCFTDIQAEKSAKLASWQEAGIVYTGETAEELAAAIGVDPEKLAKTFADYQDGIAKGEDRFNRTKLPANFDGPYYAVKQTGEIRHTQGGIVTDVTGHALRADGSIIKGLFAAGGCTEGYSSRGGAAYMSGNGLIQALAYGKLSGTRAAMEDPQAPELATWEKSEIDAYI